MRFEDDAGRIGYGTPTPDGRTERLGGDPLDPTRPLTPDGQATVKRLLAPVEPVNIFCIGANYAAHAREFGREPPKRPVIFMKPTSSLNHPGGPIRVPKCEMAGPETDYECELAAVIGTAACDVPEADALKHVLGYTCANDVSARRWQKEGSGGQWVRGKGFDTFCPMGPVLVTADEIPDPQTLSIQTKLNGQVMQDAHTSDMIFSVARLIHLMSQDTTLLPGTVILTGTCEGVGFARDPQVLLKDGDEVTIEIEKIGALTNPVMG